MKEAILYEKLPESKVRCHLCAHRCLIAQGKKGICQVRENRDGILYTLVYGRTISQNVDPVEKKPLFHFYPGSTAYSIATPGCNFRCAWCQNWEISQMPRQQHLIAGWEVTTLVIPGINDATAELREAAQFIAQELGTDTPWHLSRFFPDYQLAEVPPTPLETLQRAWEIGQEEGLKYVYLGNIPNEESQNTFCPDCGEVLIRRSLLRRVTNRLQDGHCPNCGCHIAGRGM